MSRSYRGGYFFYIHLTFVGVDRRVVPVTGLDEVVGHQVAPADLLPEGLYLRECAALAAVRLVVVVFAVMLLTPFRKQVHFGRVGEHDLEMGFLRNRFQVVVQVMMMFVTMADDLGCVLHTYRFNTCVDQKKSVLFGIKRILKQQPDAYLFLSVVLRSRSCSG